MADTNYSLLVKQADALTKDVPHLMANLANVSALLYTTLKDINWAGFYLMEDFLYNTGDFENAPSKGKLILGPFQGNPACIEIAPGKGVCGTAAAEDHTQLVPDVHQFEGHIPCDSASRSEIVVPLHKNGKVMGVLDIDSPLPARFTEEDRQGLEALALLLEKNLF